VLVYSAMERRVRAHREECREYDRHVPRCFGPDAQRFLTARRLVGLVARDAQTADAHAMIARDERRHAELAWRVLGWAWREGGTRVRDAIVAAADGPPHAPAPAIDPSLDRDWLEARGWPGPAAAPDAADDEAARARTRLRRMVG